MEKPKIIAFHLPQYHTFQENDEWWGKGFTDWTNVRKAKPLYKGHYQPRIPLNQNYYNMLDYQTRKWQAETAQKYGVYGFCYYHYWFNGKLLMQKPVELLLNEPEISLPFCFQVTGRGNIFALMGCFHGMSLGALSLTTERAAREGAGVGLDDVTHIPAPYMFPELDTIKYMERLLQDDHSGIEKPAALIIETVQAEGGIEVLSVDWLQRARAFCDKYDILMIVDEIQTGNCRTGTFFSFERAGIHPDIITMAKSIGGMGMPMALTLFKPELDIWSPGEHNGTFRGFQLAAVAGKAGLEYMLDNHIEAETLRKGEIICEAFSERLNGVGEKLTFRGIGLMWGIDFSAYPTGMAKKASAECFNRGLIIELAGREDCVLKLMPPLNISDESLKKGLDIIFDAINALNLKELL